MALHTEPQSIFEAAARHRTVRIICPRCQRWKTFDPHGLWWLFHRKGWNDRFDRITARFRCTNCRGRIVRVELSTDYPTGDQPPLPPYSEWKRAANSYRG